MAIPRFTTRQLLLYVTWMCVGFGGISFSLRSWNLTGRPEHDILAGLEQLARSAGFLVGWFIVCAATICMATTQRRGGLLIAVLVLTLPFAFVVAVLDTSIFGNGNDPKEFGVLVAATLAILGAIAARRVLEKQSSRSINRR